jgi:hypothetical protein
VIAKRLKIAGWLVRKNVACMSSTPPRTGLARRRVGKAHTAPSTFRSQRSTAADCQWRRNDRTSGCREPGSR